MPFDWWLTEDDVPMPNTDVIAMDCINHRTAVHWQYQFQNQLCQLQHQLQATTKKKYNFGLIKKSDN